MNTIEGKVGEPTPLPEMFETYLVRYIEHDHWSDAYFGIWKDNALVFQKDHPGSVLVTIPGTVTASAAQPLCEYHELAWHFVNDIAEMDCTYPDSPCLEQHPSKLGHGTCLGCQARLVKAKRITSTRAAQPAEGAVDQALSRCIDVLERIERWRDNNWDGSGDRPSSPPAVLLAVEDALAIARQVLAQRGGPR